MKASATFLLRQVTSLLGPPQAVSGTYIHSHTTEGTRVRREAWLEDIRNPGASPSLLSQPPLSSFQSPGPDKLMPETPHLGSTQNAPGTWQIPYQLQTSPGLLGALAGAGVVAQGHPLLVICKTAHHSVRNYRGAQCPSSPKHH